MRERLLDLAMVLVVVCVMAMTTVTVLGWRPGGPAQFAAPGSVPPQLVDPETWDRLVSVGDSLLPSGRRDRQSPYLMSLAISAERNALLYDTGSGLSLPAPGD